MLRRSATVLTVTSEDIAAYEDCRACEALAVPKHEHAAAKAESAGRHRPDFPRHDLFAQQAYLKPAEHPKTSGASLYPDTSSPLECHRMIQAQMLQQTQARQPGGGRTHLPPPPGRATLQQRLVAAAAQGEEQDYTEQTMEMLIGSSDEESVMEDVSSRRLGMGA